MTEQLEHTLRTLSRLPEWTRYSVDDWCLEVARAARCGVDPVRAVARSLGLYAAEVRQSPRFAEDANRRTPRGKRTVQAD